MQLYVLVFCYQYSYIILDGVSYYALELLFMVGNTEDHLWTCHIPEWTLEYQTLWSVWCCPTVSPEINRYNRCINPAHIGPFKKGF